MKKLSIYLMLVFALFAFASPAFAADGTPPASGTDEFANILLGVLGAVVSLAFRYIPALQTWFEGQGKYKGLIMLGLVVVVALAYYGLACSPYAATLGITLECGEQSIVTLVHAVVSIALGNQLTYLFSRSGS